MFWVTFGLVEYDIIDMWPYNNYVTQNLAYILLGAYMVSVGLVMLNMLIAMMSRSFDQIAVRASLFAFIHVCKPVSSGTRSDKLSNVPVVALIRS